MQISSNNKAGWTLSILDTSFNFTFHKKLGPESQFWNLTFSMNFFMMARTLTQAESRSRTTVGSSISSSRSFNFLGWGRLAALHPRDGSWCFLDINYDVYTHFPAFCSSLPRPSTVFQQTELPTLPRLTQTPAYTVVWLQCSHRSGEVPKTKNWPNFDFWPVV